MSTCAIDDCSRPARGRGLCQMHWRRWRRHGDPAVVLPRRRPPSPPCVVEGCDEPSHAQQLCSTHYTRLRRRGDPLLAERTGRPLTGEQPTYTAVHKRLERTRGAASGCSCVDCGRQAAEWSYDSLDPDELTGESNGVTLRYSLDLDHYVPRCVRCHRRFDLRPHTIGALEHPGARILVYPIGAPS